MMRNIEIKAKVNDYSLICRKASSLSGKMPTVINQFDVFYIVNKGRLKLRTFENDSATLVRYEREDREEPKLSSYDLLHFTPEESDKAKLLDEMLEKSCGVLGRVVKQRKIYIVDQTRIHIDIVEDLGYFMELEVVLREDQSEEDGQKIAKELQAKLGVKNEDLIDGSYLDLLK